jgi:hypothetical protein
MITSESSRLQPINATTFYTVRLWCLSGEPYVSCLKCVFVLYTCSIALGIEQRLSSVHVIILVTCGVLNYFIFRKVPPLWNQLYCACGGCWRGVAENWFVPCTGPNSQELYMFFSTSDSQMRILAFLLFDICYQCNEVPWKHGMKEAAGQVVTKNHGWCSWALDSLLCLGVCVVSRDVDKQLRLTFLMIDRVGEEGITYKIVVISFGAYFFLQTLVFICVFFVSTSNSIGIRNINYFIVQLMYKVEMVPIMDCVNMSTNTAQGMKYDYCCAFSLLNFNDDMKDKIKTLKRQAM